MKSDTYKILLIVLCGVLAALVALNIWFWVNSQVSVLSAAEAKFEAIEQEYIEEQQYITEKAAEIEAEQLVDMGEFVATAYCNCKKCCGKWSGGPTASGAMPIEGITVAVDKSVIPLGSVVVLEGIGDLIAQDTGSAIKGKRLDIYMNDHQEALNYGKQTVNVKVKEME